MSVGDMIAESNEFEPLVSAEKMPPCPLCGLPLLVEPRSADNVMMVFRAHGMIALAHDACHPTRKANPADMLEVR